MEYGHRVPKRVAGWANGDMGGEHQFRVHIASDPLSLNSSFRESNSKPEDDKLAVRSPASRNLTPMALLHRTLSIPSPRRLQFCSLLFWFSMVLFSMILIFRSTLSSPVEFWYYSVTEPSDGRPNPWAPRVAICLAGGLRHFELTGESIKLNLLSAYPNTDVFVVTPRDEDAWKIHLLSGSNVVGVKIAEQRDYILTDAIKSVIHESASPKGRQGLLKYLGLVQGCKELIEEHEVVNGFQYEWIIRTRPDAVWSTKSPPLRNFKRSYFHIPEGSDWWGMNDRFTLGNREDSLASFGGLSSISRHYELNHTSLTSEEKFQKLLEINGIWPRIRRGLPIPFCVLTKRSFSFPPLNLSSAPVAPLGSFSARNGAYCWPCKAETNVALIRQVPTHLFGFQEDLCNVGAQNQWPSYWRELFDSSVSAEISKARKDFEINQNYKYCLIKVYGFMKGLPIQKGGSTPEKLCRLGFPWSIHNLWI